MSLTFVENWASMSVTERIDHLLADWKTCHSTREVMVLKVAASVSHNVLEQAGEEIKRLHSEALGNERRMQDQGAIMAKLWERIHALTAERDEARRELSHEVFVNGDIRPADYAKYRGWDCYSKENK